MRMNVVAILVGQADFPDYKHRPFSLMTTPANQSMAGEPVGRLRVAYGES